MIVHWHQFTNCDAIRKCIEAAFREGFQEGADHGNLEWKYPPEDVAFLIFKQRQTDVWTCLTREELAAIQAWEDSNYKARCEANNAVAEAEE